MTGIVWKEGHPPETLRGKRLLLIASPMNMNFDAAADNRPDIFIGHHGEAADDYVPALVQGMLEGARQYLAVKYWAEINLPDGVELRSLTDSDLKG